MTNHELTLKEREKAANPKTQKELKAARNARKRERQKLAKKIVWEEGEKKPIERPSIVLYYPPKPKEYETKEVEGKEKKIRIRQKPEIAEFVSRKDSKY